MAKVKSQPKTWTKVEITEKLQRTLSRLTKKDSFIIAEDVNERSMTHVFATYLADEFPEYHVDCEYNRMLGKNGEQIKKQIYGRTDISVPIDDLDATTVFPDIIVHRREGNLDNLLIVEAKKRGRDPRPDYEKLNIYMQERDNGGLGYNFSAFVVFDTESPEASTCEVKDKTEHWG